jgi:hypothetical protein
VNDLARRVPTVSRYPLTGDSKGSFAVYALPLRPTQRIWYTASVRLPYAGRIPKMAASVALDCVRETRSRVSRRARDLGRKNAARAAADLLLNTSACVGFSGKFTLEGESALRFEYTHAPWIPRQRAAPVDHLTQVQLVVRDSMVPEERVAILGQYRLPSGQEVATEGPYDLCYIASALAAYGSHPAVHLNAGALPMGEAAGTGSPAAHANIQGLNRAANNWPAYTLGREYSDNRKLLTTSVVSDTMWHHGGEPCPVPYSNYYRAVVAAHRTAHAFGLKKDSASQWVAAFVMHDLDHLGYAEATRFHGFNASEFHQLRVLRHAFIAPPRRSVSPPDESAAQKALRQAVARAVSEEAPELSRRVGKCWSV